MISHLQPRLRRIEVDFAPPIWIGRRAYHAEGVVATNVGRAAPALASALWHVLRPQHLSNRTRLASAGIFAYGPDSVAAGAAALPAASRIARAQTYPARQVTIIDAFSPSGTTDAAARIVGQHMSRTLGQQFIVENVPGAGATTGSMRAGASCGHDEIGQPPA